MLLLILQKQLSYSWSYCRNRNMRILNYLTKKKISAFHGVSLSRKNFWILPQLAVYKWDREDLWYFIYLSVRCDLVKSRCIWLLWSCSISCSQAVCLATIVSGFRIKDGSVKILYLPIYMFFWLKVCVCGGSANVILTL